MKLTLKFGTTREEGPVKFTAKINKVTGVMEFLGQPPPGLVLPGARKERFSLIEPTNTPLWCLFRVLRWVFGEQGRVADWTRRWPCIWEARILMGPMRGKRRVLFDREELVRWEHGIWKCGGES